MKKQKFSTIVLFFSLLIRNFAAENSLYSSFAIALLEANGRSKANEINYGHKRMVARRPSA